MRQTFEKAVRPTEFKLEPLINIESCGSFDCSITEYNNYLVNDALRSMSDHIALTWLLTVDIEHDKGVIAFYEKNGFIPNAELYNKNRKTISMRKDIYG